MKREITLEERITNNMRDTLFISHATPEDNDFAIWLASRLEMLGYKIWIDKNYLLGGEKIWPTIQNVIKDNAIKILLVYSENICKNNTLKDGIDKELSYAESIATQKNINDFIIPLNIDNFQYNAFIGANRLKHIPFDINWAEGLDQLKNKLEKDGVPKTRDISSSSFSEWYENEYISNCSIIDKSELFYTSWWKIIEMPQMFYIYQFDNLEQAKVIRDVNTDTPISLQANVLSSFDDKLIFHVEKDNEQFDILPKATYSFSINDVLNGFKSDYFPEHRDVVNYYKRLLSFIMFQFFKKKGLWRTELSNRKLAFYLPLYNNLEPIRFHYPFSKTDKAPKRKYICGKFETIGKWHFAVSLQTFLFPFIGFSLKSHLVFTEDGFKIISDTKKAHSYRRRKGKRFFNEEWRDMLLAFLQRLKDKNGEIKIQVSSNKKYVKMNEWPEMFFSKKGYIDPKTEMNLDKIENYVDESEEEEVE